MIPWTIRPAELADAADMLLIEQQVTSYPWTLSLYQSCFSERYFNFVIEVEGIIAGFYIGEFVAQEASLFNIVVSANQQGRGLGRVLLEHFIAQADAKLALECWLEVRASNASAIALYQSAGFHQTGLRRNYYPTPSGNEDAILMGLPLRMG